MISFTEEDVAKIPRKTQTTYMIDLSANEMITWIKQRIGPMSDGGGCVELKLHMADGYIWIVYSGGPQYPDIQMSDFDNIQNYMRAVDAQEPIGMKYNIHYKGHGPRSNQFPEYYHIFGSGITDDQLQEILNRAVVFELMIDDCEEGCECDEELPLRKTEITSGNTIDWKPILEHIPFKINYRETSHEYRSNPHAITHLNGEKLDSELSLETLYILSDLQKILSNQDDDMDEYDSKYKTIACKIIRTYLES